MKNVKQGIAAGLIAIASVVAMARPVVAQTVDLAGIWTNLLQEDGQAYRMAGPNIGDYTGHPLTDAARRRADSWSASRETVPEFQCIPHPVVYWQNAGSIRITPKIDPVTKEVAALNMDLHYFRVTRDIWLDGRPHPSQDARHGWTGFSTGVWTGNMLTITTTHLKEGRVARNGIDNSDRAVLVEHIMRHGDLLTWVSIINDPIQFEEPMIHTRSYYLDPGVQIGPYSCVAATEIDRPIGLMPHWLPGQNKSLRDWAQRFGVPFDAAEGHARTLLPEYRKEIRKSGGTK